MVTLINSAEPQITRQPELIPRKVPIVRAGTSRIDTTDTITETGDQPPVPLRKAPPPITRVAPQREQQRASIKNNNITPPPLPSLRRESSSKSVTSPVKGLLHKPRLPLWVQIVILVLSVVEWIIGFIPIVNIVSGVTFWLIKGAIYLYFGRHYFLSIPFITTNFTAIVLSLIPFVNWAPWVIISSALDMFDKVMLKYVHNATKLHTA